MFLREGRELRMEYSPTRNICRTAAIAISRGRSETKNIKTISLPETEASCLSNRESATHASDSAPDPVSSVVGGYICIHLNRGGAFDFNRLEFNRLSRPGIEKE